MSYARPQPLIIFPCNGNGLEALDCLGEDYEVIGFIDDDERKRAAGCHSYPVLERRALSDHPGARVLAVPGSPSSYRMRRAIIEGLGLDPERFARVIHPTARISPRARVGRNVLIMAGVVITGNAFVGDHVCILPNSVVHHDSVVSDWCLVGSTVTIAGNTHIGENCYIGSGSSIINGATVGRDSLVGLGTNVISAVPAGANVVGNPARRVS